MSSNPEWCIVNDEGMIADQYYTEEEAKIAMQRMLSTMNDQDNESALSVDLRERYDDDGEFIEDDDSDMEEIRR